MIKIALVGLGHFGKNHLRCILDIPQYELIGVYDIDQDVAQSVAKEFKVPCYTNLADLINDTDVVDIVTPTSSHYEILLESIKAKKHVFVEKPFVSSIDEAKKISSIINSTDLKIQVGHIERFNPAFLAIENLSLNPKIIEVNRSAKYNPRGMDVSVVMDLMIHDLDIILKLVHSKISSIQAKGLAVVNGLIDIASVRINFENGTVANINTNRLATEATRELRLFEENSAYHLDFINKTAQKQSFHSYGNNAMGELLFHDDIEQIECVIKETNALKLSLITFADSVFNDESTKVNCEEGVKAVKLAELIQDKIEKSEPLILPEV